jgi:hypothetical protein
VLTRAFAPLLAAAALASLDGFRFVLHLNETLRGARSQSGSGRPCADLGARLTRLQSQLLKRLALDRERGGIP